ncbi:MAG: hypothetical protein ABSE49_35670 [Polyangiaceae bacterium]|jgi:hypothetical protein
MDSILLQNWVTISADQSLTSIGQGADQWFDLGDYEDIQLILEVTEVTGTVTMNYETSPSFEEASFMACVTPFTIATGVQYNSVLAAYAPVPVAQYLRWRLSSPGGSGWDVMFRIWLSAYSLVP